MRTQRHQGLIDRGRLLKPSRKLCITACLKKVVRITSPTQGHPEWYDMYKSYALHEYAVWGDVPSWNVNFPPLKWCNLIFLNKEMYQVLSISDCNCLIDDYMDLKDDIKMLILKGQFAKYVTERSLAQSISLNVGCHCKLWSGTKKGDLLKLWFCKKEDYMHFVWRIFIIGEF